MRYGCQTVDYDRLHVPDDTLKDDLAGTTAVVVLLKEGRMFCVSTIRITDLWVLAFCGRREILS